MKTIIEPVSKEELVRELTKDKFVRSTNKGKNEIYIFDYKNSPKLMIEVGRLRELSFRTSGGGSGNELDIDVYDLQSQPYKQLIVWNPDEKEIIGGYRFALANEVSFNGKVLSNLAINHYFHLSKNFLNNYLPYSIELGRAFVQPKYQSTQNGNKSLFALDNLWDGLGALIRLHPKIKYFYGKVTFYKHFDHNAKALLLNFLHAHFEDLSIMTPINKVNFELEGLEDPHFGIFNFEEEFRVLKKQFRENGYAIPPLVNSYIGLSPSLKVFGSYHDSSFGNVDETGMMITIADIYPNKVERHIKTHSGLVFEEI